MEPGNQTEGVKVKRLTLAHLGINLREMIAEKLRHVPNVGGWSLVRRKGRMEVQVQVKESDGK